MTHFAATPAQVRQANERLEFGLSREEAIEQGICKVCRKPPVFNTSYGQYGYSKDAICEDCFDEITRDQP